VLSSRREIHRGTYQDSESFPESDPATRVGSADGQYGDTSEHSKDLADLPEGNNSSASSLYRLEKKSPEPPYHVFSRSKKKQLVYLVSLAGLFSPLSSNIYFSAMGIISKVCLRCYRVLHHYHRYLGPQCQLVTSQSYPHNIYGCPGHRSVALGSVIRHKREEDQVHWLAISYFSRNYINITIGTFLVYLVANVGLAFSSNFTYLMVFRAVRAAGSAATISVGQSSTIYLSIYNTGVLMFCRCQRDRRHYNCQRAGFSDWYL
jgi:hypothetical protein